MTAILALNFVNVFFIFRECSQLVKSLRFCVSVSVTPKARLIFVSFTEDSTCTSLMLVQSGILHGTNINALVSGIITLLSENILSRYTDWIKANPWNIVFNS